MNIFMRLLFLVEEENAFILYWKIKIWISYPSKIWCCSCCSGKWNINFDYNLFAMAWWWHKILNWDALKELKFLCWKLHKNVYKSNIKVIYFEYQTISTSKLIFHLVSKIFLTYLIIKYKSTFHCIDSGCSIYPP